MGGRGDNKEVGRARRGTRKNKKKIKNKKVMKEKKRSRKWKRKWKNKRKTSVPLIIFFIPGHKKSKNFWV